jgi:predicted Kef-type K+ transport protein
MPLPHDTPLIATIVAGLSLAFVLGVIAQRARFSPLVGYLLAGVVVGPFTPGFIADQALAQELAELGVILLMFGVGLHFSLKDLLSVRAIAIPGAVAQIAVASLLGLGLALTLGWSLPGGLVFGLALSVASTVVCCVLSRSVASLRPNAGASPWAGSSSRIWRWCSRLCCCLRSGACSPRRTRPTSGRRS